EGSGLPERLVSPCVILVPVRVHNHAHGLVTERLERSLDLVGELCVLVVDQEHAVCAGRRPDVAAGAKQDIDAFGELFALDLDLGEVLVLGPGPAGQKPESQGKTERGSGTQHRAPPKGLKRTPRALESEPSTAARR